MCWQCTHPQATHEQWLEHVQSVVDRHGWMVEAVGGARCQAPFAYTVGPTPLGIAELVVTGVKAADACRLLDHVAEHVIDRTVGLPGETMGTGLWDLEALTVTDPTRQLLKAVEVYGPAVRGLQLAWADDRGHWTWERGHRAGRGGQPLLGPREPWTCPEHRPAPPR